MNSFSKQQKQKLYGYALNDIDIKNMFVKDSKVFDLTDDQKISIM